MRLVSLCAFIVVAFMAGLACQFKPNRCPSRVFKAHRFSIDAGHFVYDGKTFYLQKCDECEAVDTYPNFQLYLLNKSKR